MLHLRCCGCAFSEMPWDSCVFLWKWSKYQLGRPSNSANSQVQLTIESSPVGILAFPMLSRNVGLGRKRKQHQKVLPVLNLFCNAPISTEISMLLSVFSIFPVLCLNSLGKRKGRTWMDLSTLKTLFCIIIHTYVRTYILTSFYMFSKSLESTCISLVNRLSMYKMYSDYI